MYTVCIYGHSVEVPNIQKFDVVNLVGWGEITAEYKITICANLKTGRGHSAARACELNVSLDLCCQKRTGQNKYALHTVRIVKMLIFLNLFV